MKKILTLFLCLAMVMAVLPIVPITVGAEEVDSSDMVTYEVSGNEAYVKTCDENAVGSVIIKSEYSDYPVTKIDSWAFNGCSGLTSITIPDSVKSIDMWSFTGLNNLETIYVNSGNTNYYSSGNSVIETATKTLIIGTKNSVISDDGSVTSIGKNAFNGRTGLAKLTIPDSVTSIGDFSFCGCY